ncbi:MAG: hypothetical protein IJC64_00200 [Clostridia bacterium]|nr:hypothetical protein [Clostridia bacterium]
MSSESPARRIYCFLLTTPHILGTPRSKAATKFVAMMNTIIMKGNQDMYLNEESCSVRYAEHLWEKSEFLKFCEGEQSIIVIGYKVRLTKSEYDIVKLVYGKDIVRAEEIVDKCLLHKDVTVGDVAIHVYNLNKKVEKVTGRRLVEGIRRKGYKIVDYI